MGNVRNMAHNGRRSVVGRHGKPDPQWCRRLGGAASPRLALPSALALRSGPFGPSARGARHLRGGLRSSGDEGPAPLAQPQREPLLACGMSCKQEDRRATTAPRRSRSAAEERSDEAAIAGRRLEAKAPNSASREPALSARRRRVLRWSRSARAVPIGRLRETGRATLPLAHG